MTKKTKVISGFPGVGKSFLANENHDLVILDSDSSQFSWIEAGVRHPNFPANYMDHIQKNLGKADIIFVSSHDVVRKALAENNIDYDLVYPDPACKTTYLKRYIKRGNNDAFLTMMEKNWENFIAEIENETFPTKIKLTHEQYLSDVLSTTLT